MNFSDYIKLCRKKFLFTQEALAHNLFVFNPSVFRGIDATTISNWEGKRTPHLSRQVEIIRFFQSESGLALPCYDSYDIASSETPFCTANIEKYIKSTKHLILDLPLQAKDDMLKVVHINQTKLLQRIISIHYDLDAGLNEKFQQLSKKQLIDFAQHHSNQFYAVMYREETILGFIFAFRLKKETFEAFMNNQRFEESLSQADFATFEEEGFYYISSFFALNKKTAALLLSKLFNHLLQYQSSTAELGTSLLIKKENGGILDIMHLHVHSVVPWHNGKKRTTYRTTLKNFFANKNMVNLLFNAETCTQ